MSDRFSIDGPDTYPGPTRAAGGRPRDSRLVEICEQARQSLIAGTFKTTRQAARHFTPKFIGKAYIANDRITFNYKAQDLQRIIERHIKEAK